MRRFLAALSLVCFMLCPLAAQALSLDAVQVVQAHLATLYPQQTFAVQHMAQGDFSGDGAPDVALALTPDGGLSSVLVLLQGSISGWTITLVDDACLYPPQPAIDGETLSLSMRSPLTALAVDAGRLVLTFTLQEGGASNLVRYAYAPAASGYTLAELLVARPAEGPRSEIDLFDFITLQHRIMTGDPQADASTWTATMSLDMDPLTAGHAVLGGLDATSFPLTYEGLQSLALRDALLRCDDCHHWYVPGSAFRSHVCLALPTGALLDEEPVQCEYCGNWYEGGLALRNHVCEGPVQQLQCELCGNWYDEGDAFTYHTCTGKPSALVQCPYCLNWFEEGTAFTSHVCPQKP